MIPPNLVKARLEQISWDKDNQVIEVEGAKKIPVQFNPDSLKVNLSNQTSGGDQRGGSAIQFVGAGTTKLSFDLWFDVTNPEHNSRQVYGFIPDDVRLLTQEIAFFITPTPDKKDKKKFIPPGVRFLWGRFLFEGVMESLAEEISYFSEDGRPLRAKVSVALMRQEIQFKVPPQKANQAASGASSGGGAGGAAGAAGPSDPDAPRAEAEEGDTVADVAGAAGDPESWPAVAAANGIENPRALAAGTVLDVSASAGASLGAGVSAGASFGASAGAGFGASASAGASAGVSASASAGAGFGAGGALGGGLRAGAAASAGGGAGAAAGSGAGASAGIGGGFGAGASAGGGIGAGSGGSFGAGASAGAAAGFGAGVSGGAASLAFEGAAGSASARANAAFDLSLRR